MSRLPTIVSQIPRDLRSFTDRVRDSFETSGVNQIITAQMLINSGIANLQGGNLVPIDPDDNFPTPPAPTNLRTLGALASIIVEWDTPTYRGHAYTEVWAAQALNSTGDPELVPSLGDAVMVGIAPGGLFSYSAGGGETRWFWVRSVNVADVKGPFNAVVGVKGVTGQDPSYLLDLLEGEIEEKHLYNILNNRIDLVDGDELLANSVDARVAAEASARSTADGKLEAQYTVKIDLNGYVSGFGLASTLNNAVPQSDFMVRADSFAIASPSGPGIPPAEPFFVQTTPTEIDGQPVPVGVYIKDAFIQNGTINSAKIGVAAIDTANIADLAVIEAKIGDAAVTTAKIENANITTALIDTAAITTAKIRDAAITTAKIGTAQIQTANIQDGAITDAKIKNATIGNAEIANGSITNAKIANATIEHAKINTVNASRITTGSLNAARINLNGATMTNSGGYVSIKNSGVDTIQIRANAVTAVGGAYVGGRVSNSGTGWMQVARVNISCLGGRNVLVGAYCSLGRVAGSYGQGGAAAFDLRWNGSSLISSATSSFMFCSPSRISSSRGGTNYAQLYVRITSGGGGAYAYAEKTSVWATEMKK